MSKVTCVCGHLFDLSKSPVEGEYSLVPEEAMFSVLDGSLTSDAVIERLDAAARQTLICPSCGRLWLQDDDSDNYSLYEPAKRTVASSPE